jgi:hypothetical protein
MRSNSSINPSALSGSDKHCCTKSSLIYLPPAGKLCIGISPSKVSMLDSAIKPCKQHAKQKSCRTESENILLVLESSNILDRVGNAFVSTWLKASVIQYSDVRGENSDAESVARRIGILLTRNDLRIVMDWARSFRNVAFANMSKAARVRSIIALLQ